MTTTPWSGILCRMEEAPRCPVCGHTEWVRGNMVVVPGADGPVRVVTRCPYGPERWTCASCEYVDPGDGGIARRLDRIPEHMAHLPWPALAARRAVGA
ncbi:MAG: hypothetical protein ACLQHS_00800 [Candidatus Limnocylindrales bacterium]